MLDIAAKAGEREAMRLLCMPLSELPSAKAGGSSLVAPRSVVSKTVR